MKTNSPKSYVLDTFALFNFLSAEEGSEKVEKLIAQARLGKVTLYFSEINLGELYYKAWKKKDEETGKAALKSTLDLPLTLVPADRNRILQSAEIKATNRISYADAFCAQTAMEKNSPILTGDPDFAKVEKVKVIWIVK